MPHDEVEVRTRSIPTAAHLVMAGFEPLGVLTYPNGSKLLRFAPAAKHALEEFITAKRALENALLAR